MEGSAGYVETQWNGERKERQEEIGTKRETRERGRGRTEVTGTRERVKAIKEGRRKSSGGERREREGEIR